MTAYEIISESQGMLMILKPRRGKAARSSRSGNWISPRSAA
jgi:hypothetical protein